MSGFERVRSLQYLPGELVGGENCGYVQRQVSSYYTAYYAYMIQKSDRWPGFRYDGTTKASRRRCYDNQEISVTAVRG